MIALGSKPSSSKSSLRHIEGEEAAKPLKSSSGLISGGNPPKKFKSAAVSGDNSGGLFSDPIRVSQVSQQAGGAGKQATPSKSSHASSPQPSNVSGAPQIIEGWCSYCSCHISVLNRCFLEVGNEPSRY